MLGHESEELILQDELNAKWYSYGKKLLTSKLLSLQFLYFNLNFKIVA